MARGKTNGKAKAPARRKKWSASRTVEHPSNGSPSASAVPEPDDPISLAERQRLAVEALGDKAIDDDMAPQQMNELGGIVEEIARLQATYDAKAEDLKTAKKALEQAQALLQSRVTEFTHPPKPLPLLERAEAGETTGEEASV